MTDIEKLGALVAKMQVDYNNHKKRIDRLETQGLARDEALDLYCIMIKNYKSDNAAIMMKAKGEKKMSGDEFIEIYGQPEENKADPDRFNVWRKKDSEEFKGKLDNLSAFRGRDQRETEG